jgi:hypothetical protein
MYLLGIRLFRHLSAPHLLVPDQMEFVDLPQDVEADGLLWESPVYDLYPLHEAHSRLLLDGQWTYYIVYVLFGQPIF